MPWWLPYALGLVGVVCLMVGALTDPSIFNIVALGGLAIFWTLLCGLWDRLTRSATATSFRILDEEKHLFTYVYGVDTILEQALEALAVWDRDRAIELASTFNAHQAKASYDFFWRGDKENIGSE